MYLPAQFKSDEPAHAAELMRSHPLATLVSTDDDALPFVTLLPLHYDAERHSVWGHCARANPHWRYLESRPRAIVLFNGPQGYLSPTVYPDLARVPTWNYLAVQLTVEARLKGAGKHWAPANVNPMLALRCAETSKRWKGRWTMAARSTGPAISSSWTRRTRTGRWCMAMRPASASSPPKGGWCRRT